MRSRAPTSLVLEALKIEIGRLQLWPGDVVVFRLPDGWSLEMCEQFYGWMKKQDALPGGVKSMMIPMSAEIGVISSVLPRVSH